MSLYIFMSVLLLFLLFIITAIWVDIFGVKSNKKETSKQYELVKSELKSFTLKCYEVQIYNQDDELIGETSAADNINYYDSTGNYSDSKPGFPSHAWVNSGEYHKFENFLNTATLIFDDYDENHVSLATDVIKKVVIKFFDESEEEVQLYKIVEKKDEN